MDRTATITEIWVFKEPTWGKSTCPDYRVDAVDGEIGTVDEDDVRVRLERPRRQHRAMDLRQEGLLPVGVINRIDEIEQMIFVNVTKDQIKNAPEFDESRFHDLAHREEFAARTTVAARAGPDYGKSDRGF